MGRRIHELPALSRGKTLCCWRCCGVLRHDMETSPGGGHVSVPEASGAQSRNLRRLGFLALAGCLTLGVSMVALDVL